MPSHDLRSRRRLLAAPLLALALLATPASALDGPAPGSDGIGDDYFPLDGNGGIDVVSYEIHDRYRFGSGRLSGWTDVRLQATQALSSFNLDLLLPVKSVRIDGEAVDWLKPHPHELEITPAAPLLPGDQVTVRVRYDGKPASVEYLGEHNWLADDREVVAMNQPHMAPWWFPANDHPRDKALVDIAITVPRKREVVANGHLVSRAVDRKKGLATVRWRADEPMVPYLAFFAAGDFAVDSGTSDGLPWFVAASRQLDDGSRRDAMRLMKRHDEIVGVLEQDLGDYPFSTTGGVATSLDSGFALENQTRPTYSPGSLNTETVVHELAHQWFGDRVAVEHWRDIWLNEGPATYYEWRYDELRGGRSVQDHFEEWYDYGWNASFWSTPIADPGADNIFGWPVYYRGGMTLAALRNRIGDPDFEELMLSWVTGRDNGSTADFTALAETVSGQDLTGFFDAWLGSGKPADTADNGLG